MPSPASNSPLLRAFACSAGWLATGDCPSGSTGSSHGLFPAEELGQLEIEDLRKLGFSRQKARSLIDLSRTVVNDGLDLEN